jgi:GR25 family glycosyltransferase involved in LPS biosynthesis
MIVDRGLNTKISFCNRERLMPKKLSIKDFIKINTRTITFFLKHQGPKYTPNEILCYRSMTRVDF